MKKDIGDHIISKLDLQDIVKVLSDELSGSELNTVLLDVFNKRVQQETPSSLHNNFPIIYGFDSQIPVRIWEEKLVLDFREASDHIQFLYEDR